MSRTLKKRIAVMALTVIILIVYARTVPQTSLVERGIVVGLGIDYSENTFEVSVQMIKPKAMGQSNSNNDSFSIYSEKGKTIGEAIQAITQKTGLNVTLSQCNILIMGNGIMQSTMFPSVSDLVNTWQLPEQSVLITTDKTALELMQTKPIASTISAFVLQQTLIGMSEYNSLTSLTVKEFIVNFMSYSKTAVVSCVTVKPVSKDNTEDSGQAASDTEYGEFDYTQSAAFSKDKSALLLSPPDTVAINYTKQGISKGGLNLVNGETKFRVELESQKCRKKCTLTGDRAEVVMKVKLKYSIAEAEDMEKEMNLNDIDEETIKKMEAQIAEEVKTAMTATFDKCKEGGYDVYLLYNLLYSTYGLKWQGVACVDYLGQINFSVEPEVKIIRK